MKSIFKKVAGIAIAAAVVLGMAGCKPNVDTHEHSFDEWTVILQPTEDEEGLRERKCSVCHYKEEETIVKLDHVHVKGTFHTAVAGTCKTKGTIEYYNCVKTSCDAKLGEDGNPLVSIKGELDSSNHEGTETTFENINAASHREIYKCCNAVKTESASHTFGEWVSNDDATITADGTKSKTCSLCQRKETLTVEGSKIIPTVTRLDENFVKITEIPIKGTETWKPITDTFVKERKFTIPSLIVCDHEVTRGEFKKIMGTDPSTAKAYDKDDKELTGDAVLNNPVNNVNWYGAIAYCNKLSIEENLEPCYSVEGITDWGNLVYSSIPTIDDDKWNAVECNFEANGYRLPTEAEWEILARGGENYFFAGSKDYNEVAWLGQTIESSIGTREVKAKKANGYGLYDMSGNVVEWCWDWYGNISSSTAGTGNSSGTNRELRGGCWDNLYFFCQVYFRMYNIPPYYQDDSVGFRVVRTAD